MQAGSVMGSSAGGAHAAIKQQKAQLASLIARLRTQRQACQVTCYLFLVLPASLRREQKRKDYTFRI